MDSVFQHFIITVCDSVVISTLALYL